MLNTIFTRTKNGFAILFQAFALIHEHKAFYWFGVLLMISYATIFGLLATCFLYFTSNIRWGQVTKTATHVSCQGTVDPGVLMHFIGLFIVVLLLHALWKNILEIAVSTYAAAAMHHDYANLKMRHALFRALTALLHVFCWVLFNMTVGFIISALSSSNHNQRNYSIADALRHMVGSMLSMAWSICTFLVPQVIAFERTGAISSIKTSFNLIKQTFGESLTANFIFSAFYSAVFMMVALSGFTLSMFIKPQATGIVVFPVIPGVLFMMVLLAASFAISLITVARMIFKTSIYFYATNKECIGFDASLLSQSFQ